MKKLNKSLIWSDHHFGRKSNSTSHNQDCIDYINWLYNIAKQDPSIDHIIFMGDYFENRSAINIATLTFAYEGSKLLNNLNIPIFFIIGNHDLYHRHDRLINSLSIFKEFTNFRVIEEPTVIPEIGNGALLCPYLFHHEYENLKNYLNVPIWFGHFEFKGFLVTGTGMRMPTGPEPSEYIGPKYIFSGHFHKRQIGGHIIYIGNTFPMDFSDAGDNDRGCATYDHNTSEVMFTNWDDCPKYLKTKLSNILDGNIIIHPKTRMICEVDTQISFEESILIKEKLQEDYKLRELIMEESTSLTRAISENSSEIDDTLSSVDELILQMLNTINTDDINNNRLISIYNNLRIDDKSMRDEEV